MLVNFLVSQETRHDADLKLGMNTGRALSHPHMLACKQKALGMKLENVMLDINPFRTSICRQVFEENVYMRFIH